LRFPYVFDPHTDSTPLDAGEGPDTRRELPISWLKEQGAKKTPKASDRRPQFQLLSSGASNFSRALQDVRLQPSL
jgi:hypothetical protein